MEERLAEKTIGEAKKKGAFGCEFFYSEGKSTSVEVRDGKVDALEIADERNSAIRLLKNGSMGFSFLSAPQEEDVDNLVDSALFSAESVTENKYNTLPTGPYQYREIDVYDSEAQKKSITEKIEYAAKMEKAARDFDPRICAVRQAAYQDAFSQSLIMNSNGVFHSEKSSVFSSSILVVAEENGVSESGYEFCVSTHQKDLAPPEEVGRKAAEMAVSMLGAGQAKSGNTTIVLDPTVGCGLLDAFSPVFSADFLQKGKSLLKGKKGEKVASQIITIIDDGCLKKGIASSPSDGEGVPSQKTTLISEGILSSFIYDSYTANKEGVESTGNGMRGSFKSPPSVSPSNIYIKPGKESREDLISGTSKGIYVLEAMGLHMIDPISGDFSVGVSGFQIENGKLSSPVRGGVISGNVLDLFMKADAVSNKCRFMGSVGSPAIRISNIDLCG